MDKVICPFCRNGVAKAFAGTQFRRCDSCGLFINMVFPSHAEELKESCRNQMLRACSDKNKERDRMTAANVQVNKLEEYTKPGTIYDVGAAAGFFMKVAQDRGWEAHGNEISESAIKWAREHYGLIINYGFLEDIAQAWGYYDAVVIWNTLEHTYNPRETLMTSKAMLKEEGLLYVKVPNKKTVEELNRFYERAHLYEFTEECLSRHLETLGFERIETHPSRNPRSKVPDCEYLYRKKEAE